MDGPTVDLGELMARRRKKAMETHGTVAFLVWEGFAIWKVFTVGFGLLSMWQFWVFVIPGGLLAAFLAAVPYTFDRALLKLLVRRQSPVETMRTFVQGAGWLVLGFAGVWSLLLAMVAWHWLLAGV